MNDELFNYAISSFDGQEVKISNMKDLYILMNDKLEFEIYKLEKKITSNLYRSMAYSFLGFLLSMLGVIIFAMLAGF